MSMFEIATRKKIRFASNKGELSVEQLWDLPLSSTRSLDLDTIAKGLAREIRAAEEESFVRPRTKSNTELTLKLEIVKHIINTKLAESEAASRRRQASEEKARLMEMLERKREEKLGQMTEEEIQARLAALSAEVE